jgi:hypothetical protein
MILHSLQIKWSFNHKKKGLHAINILRNNEGCKTWKNVLFTRYACAKMKYAVVLSLINMRREFWTNRLGKHGTKPALVVAPEMLYRFRRGMYQDTAVKLKEDKVQPSRLLNGKHPARSVPTLPNLLARSLGSDASPVISIATGKDASDSTNRSN